MAEIVGVDTVIAVLKKLKAKYGDKTVSVIVGFTASYALYVHENMEMPHKVGQAKFLEEPFRKNRKEVARIIIDAAKKGVDLDNALVLGGLRLQREAQLLTPVDTGNLKNSAFTRKE